MEGKRNNENKATRLSDKYAKKVVVPEVYKGVCIGDEQLEKLAGEVEKEKPTVLAGIEGITEEQEVILMIPPNHRIFPRLNLESFETELEKCNIKGVWEKIRGERNNEEMYKAIE